MFRSSGRWLAGFLRRDIHFDASAAQLGTRQGFDEVDSVWVHTPPVKERKEGLCMSKKTGCMVGHGSNSTILRVHNK